MHRISDGNGGELAKADSEELKQRWRRAIVPDMVVVTGVKTHVPGSATVSVVIRGYNMISGGDDKRWSSVVRIDQGSEFSFAVAAFSPTPEFLSLTPLASEKVGTWYRFTRGMAPYMLLNDLLGGDAFIPRMGCMRAADAQFYSVPGVRSEIQQAFATVPEQDAATLDIASTALRSFESSKQARNNALTLKTLAELGRAPTLSLVYRDAATWPAAAEYDVVRLSNSAVRTYMELVIEDGKGKMSAPALCVVGDTRCANYYEWP